MRPDLDPLTTFLEELALEAGRVIMPFYEGACPTEIKADASPVTAADQAAEAFIVTGLRSAYSAIPVIAEEEICAGHMPPDEGDLFFLVDPLDGTKEFINKRSDFTVNIALIEKGTPVAGVVYAPARQLLYSGIAAGPNPTASKMTVQSHAPQARSIISVSGQTPPRIAVASRSHLTVETEQFLQDRGITDTVSVGSSLKFCLLAEGAADIYPRFGRTMEWDTAAGDAVLRAAGGMTRSVDGTPLIYNKRQIDGDTAFANPAFVAWGSVSR